ncbi:hypothetical protein Leryth_018853 [Lithospermum erythrorhizon]|nr:hypothetical protein Leryth_018853 [Lithospermum erythrorhizon]
MFEIGKDFGEKLPSNVRYLLWKVIKMIEDCFKDSRLCSHYTLHYLRRWI